MSTPETTSGGHIEHSQQPESSDPFVLAAKFHADRPAKRAYFSIQETLYRSPDNDLSVFRFLLNRVPHVVVLGAVPDQTLEQRLRKLLAAGDLATLPADVIATLLARRLEATGEGSWVERHYRPGLNLGP